MASFPHLVRGITLNYAATAVSIVIAFLVAPVMVLRLGDTRYGLWVLIGSTVSYMNLLDLGLLGGVTRFVARGYAQGAHEESSAAVSSALWARTWIAVVVMGVSGLLAFLFPVIFHVPADLVRSARIALLVMAVSLTLTLLLNVYGAVLAALQRFDIISSLAIGQGVARAVGVVTLLSHDYGLVGLAVWELTVALIVNACTVLCARQIYPMLRVRLTTSHRRMLRELWTFSLYSFLINASALVVYHAANIIIGAMVSAGAVTYFSIASNLAGYAASAVGALTVTFTPIAATLDAQSRQADLQRLFIRGTQAALAISLPLQVGLIFRSETFIRLWMQPQYAELSSHILQILIIGQILHFGNIAGMGIAFGMGKHAIYARWSVVGTAIIVALSIALAPRFGIYGVALGTTIPAVILQLAIGLRLGCRLVDLPVRTLLQQAWLRSALPIVPFGFACYLVDRYTNPNLLWFILQMAALLTLYFMALAATYPVEAKWVVGRILDRSPAVPADS